MYGVVVKLAKQESLMLRAQYKAQEDDREYLVRQLVLLRKENQRQKEEMENLRSQVGRALALYDRLGTL